MITERLSEKVTFKHQLEVSKGEGVSYRDTYSVKKAVSAKTLGKEHA